MKVFLKKDIERVGMSGEIVKVGDGFARNYLLPRGLAVEITSKNEEFYKDKVREVEHRKEVIESKTSMLAEKIKSMKLTFKKKTHDDGKLFGALSSSEIAQKLSDRGISVAKNQVMFDKSIKTTGTYPVTIKLTSRLKPTLKITVVSE